MQDSVRQRAERYRVEDVPAANVPGTRLANILQLLEAGRPASETTQAFLASRGLHALSSYAKGGMADADFAKAAQAEQEARRGAAEQARAEATARADARNAEMQAHQQAIEADRLRRESDPRCIARRRNQALREKYGIPGYVEQDHFQRLMAILTRLDNRGRVAETEMVWLATEGREHRTEQVLRAYHRIEADAALAEYHTTANVWKAVTASGHLRKCGASQEAHDLLANIPERRQHSPKLKSAVRTTHGGALRDLNRREEALRLAEDAHTLFPDDFRPCTLLGAIHMEQREIALGHEWYQKAEERGAPPKHVDSEIRSILTQMPQEERAKVIEQLLVFEPFRYDWLRQAFTGGHGQRAGGQMR